jgi:hypothetical protein
VSASALFACGSDDGSTGATIGSGPEAGEAAADTAAPPPSTSEAKQKGRIIDAITKFGITGATVAVGAKSAVTAADGTYEIVVPRDTAYSMSVTESEHYKLDEQPWILKAATFDRGDTALLSTDIANLLASLLPPRDPAKGLLVVKIIPLPPCDSEQGSTLSIAPAGTAKVTYFAGGEPNKAATSATKGEVFSGGFSDVDIDVPLTVTVSSPTCEAIPFPVDYDGVTYTGSQRTEGGAALSYLRVFIGPKKAIDAGPDAADASDGG